MTGQLGYAGHFPACRDRVDCLCEALRLADLEVAGSDDLDCAYGQFYDPDFDADPCAVPEPYGGWNRAIRGQQ